MEEPQARSKASSPDNLALHLQELFTAVVRLRSRRQEVGSAETFRNQVLHALKNAEQAARAQGYADEDIRLASFAIVAFLDESLLNLRLPVFNEWVRKPLQEELFGRHVGGEVFFDHLQELLGRRDAPETADVLEVYYLCLLLGYLGKYSISSKGDLRALMGRAEDKINRIRKSSAAMSPQWALPEEGAGPAHRDPWLRRLIVGGSCCAGVAFLLLIVYKLWLEAGVSTLAQLAAKGHP